MADDFTGVPVPEWVELRARVHVVQLMAVALGALMLLTVAALVRNGHLSGWSDLVRVTS